MNNKRLTKSQTDRKVCGVCSGLAEYFNVDPTLVRIGWIIFSVMGGAGVIAYIAAAIVMPD